MANSLRRTNNAYEKHLNGSDCAGNRGLVPWLPTKLLSRTCRARPLRLKPTLTQVNTIYDWNAEHLQAFRDETNHIGQDLPKLQEGRLTPTEERALNHAILLLKTMAANTANVAQAEKIFQSLRPYEGTRGPLESRQEQKGNPDASQPQDAGR